MKSNIISLRLFEILNRLEGSKAYILEEDIHRVKLGTYDFEDWCRYDDSYSIPFVKIFDEELFDRSNGQKGSVKISLTIGKIERVNSRFILDTVPCRKCHLKPEPREYASSHNIKCVRCRDYHWITLEHQELLDLGFEEQMIDGTYFLTKQFVAGNSVYDFKLFRASNVFKMRFAYTGESHGETTGSEIIQLIRSLPSTN
jgi:hypothetical protein